MITCSLADRRALCREYPSPGSPAGDELAASVLSVGSSCRNAGQHPDEASALQVSLEFEHEPNGWVTVTVVDTGRWKSEPSGPDRGRGVMLMRRIMDHVDITPSPSGTVVMLRKRLAPVSVDG